MNCERFEQRLDTYVDVDVDTIDVVERRQLDQHVERCVRCRRRLEELSDLLAASRRLPAEVAPETDLWPGIASRLSRPSRSWRSGQGRRSSVSWALLAASLLAVVALSAIVALRWTGPRTGNDVEPVIVLDDSTGTRVRMAAARARVADGTIRPRRDLVEAIERRRGRLDSATVTDVEASAWLIDQAIGEIRQAMDEYPSNGALNLLLASRYRQEVELLKRVQRL